MLSINDESVCGNNLKQKIKTKGILMIHTEDRKTEECTNGKDKEPLDFTTR